MGTIRAFAYRLWALTRKEFNQMLREKSSFLMGVALPLVLIFIIGYGMSLDVEHVPTAVVLEDSSPTARGAASVATGSKYFSPVYVHTMQEAEKLMQQYEVKMLVHFPSTFTEDLYRGNAQIQVILNGVEATTAMSGQAYMESALMLWLAKKEIAAHVGQAVVMPRVWFNDTNTSTWFFVPGILMLVLTISGVFLTAMVMAREWERGTFEALFVSPVRILEIVIAKVLPYFTIAIVGMLLCLLAGRLLYDLPMRGSMVLIIGESMLFLIIALSLGLVISAITKNQFLACQVALFISFLPTIMLSGFLFDTHSQPWGVQLVSRFLPTTYYLEMMKSLFLSGTYWPLIIKNTLILLGYAVFFISLAFKLTRKKVE